MATRWRRAQAWSLTSQQWRALIGRYSAALCRCHAPAPPRQFWEKWQQSDGIFKFDHVGCLEGPPRLPSYWLKDYRLWAVSGEMTFDLHMVVFYTCDLWLWSAREFGEIRCWSRFRKCLNLSKSIVHLNSNQVTRGEISRYSLQILHMSVGQATTKHYIVLNCNARYSQ